MFSKSAFVALSFAAFGLASPAIAQVELNQVEDEGMGDLNAWGQRYLDIGEKEFPINLWRGSDDDTLLALLQSVRTAELTPAERSLLRRAVLSPSTEPRGAKAEALLAERARLMLELGEARAAAALAPQLKQDPRGLDAETLAVDLDMASGREASACGTLAGPVKEGVYWLKLRAVCAVLQDNYAGAQLAIEFAAAQGVSDDWMVEAIFAAAGDSPNAPSARFDSGLNIALSSKAQLDTSTLTLAGDRPDLAAAAALRPGVPNDLRARFAEIAAEFDLISPEDRRDILLTRLEDPDYTASSAIEQTLRDLTDPLVSDETRAAGLYSVLEAAARSDLARYRSTSQLFLEDLATLPQNDITAPYALDYARAAMMGGDRELAMSWLGALEIEGAEAPDPYQIAVLEAVDIIAGGDASPASLSAVEKRLVTTADTTPKEIQTVGILTSWTGLGLSLTPVGRDFVSQAVDRGIRIPQGQLTSLKAAAQSDAIGEAAMMVLAITNGKSNELAPVDFAALLETLRAMDADEIARGLALENSNFWKVPE